jgi:PIN domain nuclease of toxin-antitoxin system
LNLLLDTHILLWWLGASERLSSKAREAIAVSERVYVSAASIWEISIKTASGNLRVSGDLLQHLKSNGFLQLPISAPHAVAAGRLPRLHGDPFDRMLVAQASLEPLTLLTSDERLLAYNAPIMFV